MNLRLGSRPAQPAPALRLSSIVSGVPDSPRALDYLSELGGWAMLGNDVAGDCEAVRWANSRRLTSALLAEERYPSQDEVWALYRTQNPYFDPAGGDTTGPGSGADGGMDTQTLLNYLHQQGGPDGVKAVAFAKLDPLNEPELDAALAIFGQLWFDVVIQQAQLDQFRAGQPWFYVPGSPVKGYHAVLGGGYSWGARNSLKYLTWAAETHCGDTYRQWCLSSAWVVIWPEHLGTKAFRAGIDTAKLADYYRAITGRALVLP